MIRNSTWRSCNSFSQPERQKEEAKTVLSSQGTLGHCDSFVLGLLARGAGQTASCERHSNESLVATLELASSLLSARCLAPKKNVSGKR